MLNLEKTMVEVEGHLLWSDNGCCAGGKRADVSTLHVYARM